MTEFELKVTALRKERNKHQRKINKLNLELEDLLKSCPHTEVTAKLEYFAGGYYDKSYTSHWNQCTLCNSKSEVYEDRSSGTFA